MQHRKIIFIVGHVSLGCFFNKCLPMSYLYEKQGLTRDECVQHCKDNRYPYAGFDHCRCFCGTNFMTYAQIASSDCKTKSKSKCRKIKPGCEASSHIEVFRTSKSYCKQLRYMQMHPHFSAELLTLLAVCFVTIGGQSWICIYYMNSDANGFSMIKQMLPSFLTLWNVIKMAAVDLLLKRFQGAFYSAQVWEQ